MPANANQNSNAIVYFDLDGVLADFNGHATRQGKLKADGRVDYDALDLDWWTSMPACEGAKEFYDEVSKAHQTEFLTAPILSAECFYGKALWVQNFTGEEKWVFKRISIVPKEKKARFAEPNAILIDDSADNIAAWEAAGGIGILHDGDFDKTRAALAEAVAKIDGKEQGFASRVESSRTGSARAVG